MREHVIADNQIRLAPLGGKARSHVHAKELDERRYAAVPGSRSNGVGRINSKYWYAGCDEFLEQIAVVASKLDYEAFGVEIETIARHCAEAQRVRQPIIG